LSSSENADESASDRPDYPAQVRPGTPSADWHLARTRAVKAKRTRTADGAPPGRQIAWQYGRHEWSGRLVKRAVLAG
jgi:hypothetical protein